ncbi:nitrous oxide reductase accessory protein NosL [Maribacter chungangensis]|uniref:Nitrous oxide reductase accessory protein NosL n=1 Tax=Maribacter chungangensis TaxID=1069117 RepID=A0ABW3AZQ3_9FLAO
MKKYSIMLLLLVALVISCTNTPKPVVYGSDGCHYCSMTIVGKQHAAQFMTKKGKTFSFDATECMLNHLKEVDMETIEVFLVNDYNAPGEFVDATKATYLISKNIPSPMGEFLTAFATLEEAKTVQAEQLGDMFTWEKLKKRFNL